MITTINEWKQSLNQEKINENLYGKVKGTIYFRNNTQKALWDHELSGQISDGYWENSGGNSWEVWCALDTKVDSNPRTISNIIPQKTNYNLAASVLLDVVGDRMICIAKMSKITTDEKLLSVAETLEGINSFDKLIDRQKASNYYKEEYKDIDEKLFNQFLNVEYTMTNLRADLTDMNKAIRNLSTTDQNNNTNNFDKKDLDRIENIVKKSNNDLDKKIQLATNMANSIKDGYKALRRAEAAKSLSENDIAEIFFDKAKELGV